MSTRPVRRIIPTSKLTADNAGDVELTSHRRAIASASAALTAACPPSSPSSPESSPPPTDIEEASSRSQTRSSPKRPAQVVGRTLSRGSVIVVSPTTSDNESEPTPKSKKQKTTPASREASSVLPGSSIIDIDDIDDPHDERLNKSDPTADLKHFFSLAPRTPGQPKRRMKCNLCA
jgi:hypothetical protein